MAYIEDDKLLKEQDPSQQNPQGDSSIVTGGQTNLGGPQSSVVGNGISTAGVGAGGTGGWTNIQAYMNANKNDTGSSQLLQNKVGGQFENEKNQIKSESEKLKSEGKSAADSIKSAYSSVGDWIDKAGKEYNYSGPQTQSYTDTLNNVQNTLNGQYSGPKSYARDISGQSQQYGQSLGNDGAFNQFMGDIYQDKGGGKLTSGGRALQTQLDVSNDALVKMRENLLKQYSGLGEYRDQAEKDTTGALGDYEQQYRTNQNAFRDYLNNTASVLDTNIAKQEANARAEYDTAFDGSDGMPWSDTRPDAISPTDRTWRGIQRTLDGGFLVSPEATDEPTRQLAAQQQALLDWYQQQDQKYGDTADAEERKWNAIQDFLGSTGDRKKQGFNVRGDDTAPKTKEEFLNRGNNTKYGK